MSQVESTLRRVNGRVLGNRNWRLTADEGWDFQRITIRRQLAEQEAREIATRLPLSPEETGDDDLSVDFYPEDYDVDPDPDPEPEPQQQNPLETFLQEVASGEIFDDSDDDYAETHPGTVTFDDNFRLSNLSEALETRDPRWNGLYDILDAMQDVHRGEIQQHEIHQDDISATHLYHATRHGIIATDRFDIYGDRNPPAWWPILESA